MEQKEESRKKDKGQREKNMMQREQSSGRQDRLHGWLKGLATANIEAAGDLLKTQSEGDGISRVGFQNIRGKDVDNGFAVAPELDAMK